MTGFRTVLLTPALALAAGAGLLSRAPLEPLEPQYAEQTAPDAQAFTPASAVFREVPYGVGERSRYRVSWGVAGRVGTGEMHIARVDTVRGRPAYHIVNTLQGRMLFARVNNRFESWLDIEGVYSHRFEQWTHEVNFRRRRTREFLPAERRWTGQTNDRPESGALTTREPLDDTSFLYFARTLNLEVGREYSFNRYWNPDGNPVRIQVLRREQVTVPAGTFNTIVLRPIIQTSGMFADGGEAEVYYAEDGARQLVMLRARASIGTLQLQLEEFEPGRRR